MIPGPNSTEMAIHIGQTRRGVPGLLISGICFIAPAALMVTVIAWLYTRFGTLPEINGVFYAIKPVVISIILISVFELARTAIKTKFLGMLALAAAALNLFGIGELTVLISAALIAFLAGRRRAGVHGLFFLAPLLDLPAGLGLLPVFLYFLKVGSVLIGSGYLLVAFMQADLVDRLGWLTQQQLLDAIAVGQLTPGPLFTTATFVGYLLLGPTGAAVATIGIFLPAFVFVAITHPFVRRMRQIESAQAVLDGINVAAVALMAVVTFHLGRAAIVDYRTAGFALVSAVLLIKYRTNSAWIVLGAGVAGLLS